MGDLIPNPEPGRPLFRGNQSAPQVPDDWGVKRFLSQVQTSLDIGSPAGRAYCLAALKDDCVPGKELINLTFEATDWLVHPVEATDPETGEVSRFVRCCLILADGRVVAFGSMGVLKDIQLICGLERPAPWHPPMKLKLRSRDIGGGKSWYILDVVRDEPPQKQRGKTS